MSIVLRPLSSIYLTRVANSASSTPLYFASLCIASRLVAESGRDVIRNKGVVNPKAFIPCFGDIAVIVKIGFKIAYIWHLE